MIYVSISTNVELPVRDAYNAKVKQELNGKFDLEFSVPRNSPNSEFLGNDVFVRTDDPIYTNYKFRIYQVREGLTSFSISAHLEFYDLRWSVVKPFTATSLIDACSKINANISNNIGNYTFQTNVVDYRAFTFSKPMSAWALIGEIQKIYGVEVYFYLGIRVEFYNSIPAPALDFAIRYGENMVGYDVQSDNSSVYTSVLPYWQKSGSSIVYGSVQDAADISWTPYRRVLAVDFSKAFESQPSAAQLNAAAAAYITTAGIGIPKSLSIKAGNVISKNTIFENVRLGSDVMIQGPDGTSASRRVVAVEYDPLLYRWTGIDLGERRATIEGIVSSNTASVDELDNNRFSAAPVILAQSSSTSVTEVNMTSGYITENFHTFIFICRNSIRNLASTVIARAEVPNTATSQYNNDSGFDNYATLAHFDSSAYAGIKIDLANWRCKIRVTSGYEGLLYGLR